MQRLNEAARRTGWSRPVVDRIEEVTWVLDYQEDLDADFLAIYGIDLFEQEISAPRYFALANRLTAYTGVMAALAERERERQPTSSTPTRTSSTAAPAKGDGEVREVSLTAFRMQFPGLVSVGGEAGGG